MNSIQRNVLQRHHQQLADDLMMTEDLFGALYHKRVFELKMIETIKAERTPLDQVHKMLTMLPKRGPDAFESFIDVINGDYPWLSSLLENSYKNLLEITRSNSFNAPSSTSETVQTTRTSEALITRNSVSDLTSNETDIKGVVGTFIHKHFGQSKRISQIDKKNMEKFLSDQLQKERRRLKSQFTVVSDEGQDTVDAACSTSPSPGEKLMLEEIDRIHYKVKSENKMEKFRFENDSYNNKDDSSRCSTPEYTTTLQKLEQEVDIMIKRIVKYEEVITQCYYTLGETDFKHSLAGLLKDLKMSNERREKELIKEKHKIEEMLTELYDYSKTINKLEMNAQQYRHKIEANEEEIRKLKQENAIIADKCRTLEAINAQHAEKEKTLENLRKMVENLKSTTVADDVTNNRSNRTEGQRVYRRPYRTGRRGSLENHTNINVRRSISKTTTNRRKPFTGRQIDTFR